MCIDLIPQVLHLKIFLLVAGVAQSAHVLSVAVVSVLAVGIRNVEEATAGPHFLAVSEGIVPIPQTIRRYDICARYTAGAVRNWDLKLPVAIVMRECRV